MIPILVENGFRAIAPDLIGFGKSDKFVDADQYTYQKHLDWLNTFIDQLELVDITLFCQDWGGLLGLRLAAERPNLFTRIIAANTTLPTGEIPFPEAMLMWQGFAKNSPDFDIGQVINMGTATKLSPEVIAAYNAPFPSEEYKAGARIFPSLVPSEPDDPEAIKNREAWAKLSQWEKPFLTIFGDADPIMKGAEKYFQKLIPGTKGQAHQIITAGHFIQEDQGELLAHAIIDFCEVKT
jgi:haloalkane dehalogenase